MEQTILTISGFDITVVQLVICVVIIALGIFGYIRLSGKSFFEDDILSAEQPDRKKFNLYLAFSFLFLTIILILRVLNLDFPVIRLNEYTITVNHIAEVMVLLSAAMLFDWVISHLVIRNRYNKREIPIRRTFQNERHTHIKATRLVRYIVYLYLIQEFLKRFDLDATLFQQEIKSGLFTIHISDIIIAGMIFLIARVVVWFITQVSLYRMYQTNEMDEGIQFAINQLVSYIIYVIAILFVLDRFLSDMSIVYGGAAALLVGVGLGLQQTFNDFFSGLVLLFERSAMVGDVLEIDGQVGRLLKIGLRASRIETRNSVSMLVPNSKLVNQSVVNWTHYDNIVRFHIDITVAYGTDTGFARKLLLDSVSEIGDVLDSPAPFVRLNDFGDHGLVLTLYFFSTQVMLAEDVKSLVRFEVERLFRENKIEIPFPQRDVWVRKGNIET